MKKAIVTFCCLILTSIALAQQNKNTSEETAIHNLLNNWHRAAAEAKFETYFSAMANDAIYIGTDATENWTLPEFKKFSKPYFDRGKAWSFTTISRNIYLKGNDVAWFDELLNTQMKICRGSGILRKENGEWKIVHYVLSMTIPNDNSDEVVKIKSPIEDAFITAHKK